MDDRVQWRLDRDNFAEAYELAKQHASELHDKSLLVHEHLPCLSVEPFFCFFVSLLILSLFYSFLIFVLLDVSFMIVFF